jgi:hypothetical protein
MTAAYDAHNGTGQFRPGNSGYRMRVEARAKIERALLNDFDFSSPAATVLLGIIVQNLFDAQRARSKVDRTRAANTARRLLAGIPRKDSLWP